MEAVAAVGEISRLQAEAAHHKSEIRRHKNRLRWTMEQLAVFEQQCRNSGIKIILKPQGEKGDLYGRDQNTH